ncbi:response regulator [uncultured Azohydromonas sp.]|jgi:Response regulator containing CheY-like receiver, AAA-type ATPase, and DNA-binding domains|uniref:response regulator n=1 Tax=uncultured Azohydromonas sp. TaxID=487342 RepID=UPI002609EFA7|nr:response regulator [uncultured Azohydromonas sp.]
MSELRRVMCVEDDADIRMILEFSLTTVGGYDVCMCPGGRSALQQAPVFRPDLVLLDVMMPDLSGPETLAALRGMPCMRGVPVVFMTAKAMPDELEQLLQHGATGLIVKPFDPMTLPKDILPYWEHGRGRHVLA